MEGVISEKGHSEGRMVHETNEASHVEGNQPGTRCFSHKGEVEVRNSACTQLWYKWGTSGPRKSAGKLKLQEPKIPGQKAPYFFLTKV